MDALPLPPEVLRQRTHGATDADSFLAVGRQCAEDLTTALAAVGRPLDGFGRVLDFGCGCGRTLRWLLPRHRQTAFFGSDTDSASVHWCAAHLPAAGFLVNQDVPSLGCADASFDLIYAISVFTHLDEEYQRSWLHELRRLVRPGGLVLLSLHGAQHAGLPPQLAARLAARGTLFLDSGHWQHTFAEWYQDSFHTRAYVETHFTDCFALLDYQPGRINGLQDLAVLQRPPDAPAPPAPPMPQRWQRYQLQRQLAARDALVAAKDRHIADLEAHIRRLESGRVMRALGLIRGRDA
ncbi:MAG TPA: class I SAM-dependent methyltransferase [Roseiflexaceae bacterium]|nr:class I SAM-dependent methyltransferase [Roseiflexaceae bacterium]